MCWSKASSLELTSWCVSRMINLLLFCNLVSIALTASSNVQEKEETLILLLKIFWVWKLHFHCFVTRNNFYLTSVWYSLFICREILYSLNPSKRQKTTTNQRQWNRGREKQEAQNKKLSFQMGFLVETLIYSLLLSIVRNLYSSDLGSSSIALTVSKLCLINCLHVRNCVVQSLMP